MAGNVLVIAACTGDTTPEENFKIDTLTVRSSGIGVYGNKATVTVPGATDFDLSHYRNSVAASLGDRVWNDGNANGIQDSGETGVSGVTVRLFTAGADGNFGTVDDVQVATTTTGTSGNYSFNGLTPGLGYQVEFVRPVNTVFTTRDASGNTLDATDSDANTTTGRSQTVTLASGENNTSIDAGVRPGLASIGDRVWEDLNFNGVQDGNEPGIGHVTVRLLNSSNTVVASTTTTTAGAYSFANLTPGNYSVQFVAPTSYFFTKADQGANDGADSDANATTGRTIQTTLDAGENDVTWDAGLYRKAAVGDRVWEDLDHDNIQDTGEVGVPGIRVSLLNSTGATVLATTTTNGSGNYLFSNLDPGNYVLRFDKGNVQFKNINLNDWMWARKDIGSNDAVDSDVAGDGVAKTNVTVTDQFTLVSNQTDLTRDAGITPLVIDLNGDGVQTLARGATAGTFDILGNGTPISSGWISRGDGFLAVDSNGNGSIDSIHELFGGLAKGSGFAQLAAYDSNQDGTVDARDARFAELRIWQDANSNHQTDAGELMTLAQAGVASLKVAYTELPFLDRQGNLHLERSSATMADGRTTDMTDVYFSVSREEVAAAGGQAPGIADLLAQGPTGPTGLVGPVGTVGTMGPAMPVGASLAGVAASGAAAVTGDMSYGPAWLARDESVGRWFDQSWDHAMPALPGLPGLPAAPTGMPLAMPAIYDMLGIDTSLDLLLGASDAAGPMAQMQLQQASWTVDGSEAGRQLCALMMREDREQLSLAT